MKWQNVDIQVVNGLLLFIAAAVLISMSFIVHRGDLSTAVLIVSGVGCFLLGVVMFAISGGERINPRMVSLLSVQASINICRISGDLGLKGTAHVIPSAAEGTTPVQFNPVGAYSIPPNNSDISFSLSEPWGMSIIPSGYPLLKELQQKYDWSPVQEIGHLSTGIKEVSEDVYQFTRLATVTVNESLLTIVLKDFRYIDCCKEIKISSAPVCCRINPCPVCSLFACMIAESMRKPCTIELVDQEQGDLIVGIRVLDTP
jgi:hypothetical protein